MTDQPRNIVSNSDYGRFDRRTVLKGAIAGLVGTVATGTASAHENTITLEAGERPAEYRIEVSGEIHKGEEAGATDRADGNVAVGMMKKTDSLDDRMDSYQFSGRIVELRVLQGSLNRVWVNGEPVDLTGFGPHKSKGTVLEDWEDGRWPDDWEGETNGYAITDDALSGEFSAEATGQIGFPNVRKSGVETAREHTYTVWTNPASDQTKPALLTNVQGLGSIMDNCYEAGLRTGQDELYLQVRSGGGVTMLETVGTSQSLSAGKTYAIAIDLGSDWVRARAFADDGTQLAATDKHEETTHSGGTPGLYTGGREIGGTRYDEVVRWPLGSM